MTETQELIDEPTRVPALREEPATNPMALLAVAVERGLSPEQLTALTDLHERWQVTRAKQAFHDAMNAAQAAMPCIVRDAQNTQTGSSYVRLETVMHRAKPIILEHGFSLSFSEAQCDKGDWKRTVCTVRHREGHSETHFIDLPVDGIGPKGNAIGGMNKVQGAISTGSYAQRVLFCRVFDLTIANTDLDGQAPNPEPSPHAPMAQPRGQRDQPPPPPISEAQLKHLTDHYTGKFPEPTGDRVKLGLNFKLWVCEVTGRTFNSRKLYEWTADDYRKCCEAIPCEALE